jgi:hypothetical protein
MPRTLSRPKPSLQPDALLRELVAALTADEDDDVRAWADKFLDQDQDDRPDVG